MLIIGKKASTLSTLHGITNCIKNETRKIVSSTRYQRLARCCVAHTYFWSSLRILFTVFLETKTHLWKQMWAISGCCIGSSGSPLHPPLLICSEAVVQRCSVKKIFLKISQNSPENTFARVSFLIKLQAAPVTLLKKRHWRRCFPVNFAKFLRAPFFTVNPRWLLLYAGYLIFSIWFDTEANIGHLKQLRWRFLLRFFR